MTATLLLLAVTAAPADASSSPDQPPTAEAVLVNDLHELQGQWVVESCVIDGDDCTSQFEGQSWCFAGSRAWYSPGGFQTEDESRFDVDRKVGPLGITLHRGGRIRAGIACVSDDHMVWAYVRRSGRTRPATLDSPKGSDVVLWTLRRVKK
jgi:uncharacterized protein (TIGR03067 family)